MAAGRCVRLRAWGQFATKIDSWVQPLKDCSPRLAVRAPAVATTRVPLTHAREHSRYAHDGAHGRCGGHAARGDTSFVRRVPERWRCEWKETPASMRKISEQSSLIPTFQSESVRWQHWQWSGLAVAVVVAWQSGSGSTSSSIRGGTQIIPA